MRGSQGESRRFDNATAPHDGPGCVRVCCVCSPEAHEKERRASACASGRPPTLDVWLAAHYRLKLAIDVLKLGQRCARRRLTREDGEDGVARAGLAMAMLAWRIRISPLFTI